ncbi:hypothetical protein Ancab_017565 [Ancistrocladus abbreviatus]
MDKPTIPKNVSRALVFISPQKPINAKALEESNTPVTTPCEKKGDSISDDPPEDKMSDRAQDVEMTDDDTENALFSNKIRHADAVPTFRGRSCSYQMYEGDVNVSNARSGRDESIKHDDKATKTQGSLFLLHLFHLLSL